MSKIKNYRELVRYLLLTNRDEICVAIREDWDISDELEEKFAKRVRSLLEHKGES